VNEGALECSAIRKQLEAVAVPDVVLPFSLVDVLAISAHVHACTMSLSVYPVALIYSIVFPGECPKAMVHTVHEISFVPVICPSDHQKISIAFLSDQDLHTRCKILFENISAPAMSMPLEVSVGKTAAIFEWQAVRA
jgi:hypothetical protein